MKEPKFQSDQGVELLRLPFFVGLSAKKNKLEKKERKRFKHTWNRRNQGGVDPSQALLGLRFN